MTSLSRAARRYWIWILGINFFLRLNPFPGASSPITAFDADLVPKFMSSLCLSSGRSRVDQSPQKGVRSWSSVKRKKLYVRLLLWTNCIPFLVLTVEVLRSGAFFLLWSSSVAGVGQYRPSSGASVYKRPSFGIIGGGGLYRRSVRWRRQSGRLQDHDYRSES